MPQLDKYSLFPQVFWLVFLFLFIYFVVLGLGLPTVFKILRYRGKYASECNSSLDSLEVEVLLLKSEKVYFDLSFFFIYKSIGDQVYRVVEESYSMLLASEERFFIKNRPFFFVLESLFFNLEFISQVESILNIKVINHKFDLVSKYIK